MVDQFLSAEAWAEFQAAYGRKVFWLDKLLLVKMPLPLGQSYLYSPRGPQQLEIPSPKLQVPNKSQILPKGSRVHPGTNPSKGIPGSSRDNFQTLLEQVKRLAKAQGAIFWRLEPNQNVRCQASEVKPVQPKYEWVLDIAKSENELLRQMKPKTRYNLGLAQKKGVLVEGTAEVKAVDELWRLIAATNQRKGLRSHPRRYYQKMVEVLGQHEETQLKLYLARYQGIVICANIVVFHGNCANYLHGASADAYRNVMAPYLLQWEAIKEAKARGCQYYNFGGINPRDPRDKYYYPAWDGITRFKQGFGGQLISYPGTFDLPINKPWYSVYTFLKRWQR